MNHPPSGAPSDDAFDLYLEDIESVEAELLPSDLSAKIGFGTASTVGCASSIGGSTAGTAGTVGCISESA